MLLTTAVGFYLGSESPINYVALFHVVFGTAAAAAGAAALNQWWERRADALMRRTRTRPIPAGRMPPLQALALGVVCPIFGVAYLAIVCNALSAALTAITVAIYIFAYTPLKRTSTANTAVGAIPGAIPPMIGWAAARGNIGAGAWALFAIVFLWQLPHFFAIAWMYREDYSRAGFRMISSDDRSGERSASQSVFFCILLLVIAGLPAFLGIATFVYLAIELLLGGLFVAVAMRFLRMRTPSAARSLFIASIVYLPLLTGGFGSDEIMSTTSATMHRAPSGSGIVWKVTLILIPLVTLALLLWLRNVEVAALRQRTVSSYGTVPSFQLTNQNGQPFGSAQLAGKIWIADFIYTTCPGPCPMISSRMSELQKPLEKTDVHLVSFSVDPEKDTPDVLHRYAEKLQAESGRWDFLTGPKSAIYKLSHDGFKLAVSDGSDAQGIPVHSTRIVLVDRHGQIRGYYDATEADAVTKLVADTNHLLREQPQ